MNPGMHSPLPDAAARERIRTSLDETLVVEAAAGTGKTTELVARIVALVTTGTARLRDVVSVTFTEKAAGEMKLRLRAGLERVRLEAPPDSETLRRATAAIEELETAHIGTIHGLCAELLRERPVEANVDPAFEVAAGDEADVLFDQAFDDWFHDTHAAPPEGVRRFLRRRSRGFDVSGPSEQLRSAARDLIEHRDFPAEWRRDHFDRTGELDKLVRALADVGALASSGRPDDWLTKSVEELARWSRELQRREAHQPRDEDGLEAQLRELARHKCWRWKGSGRWFARDVTRADVVARRDAVKAKLDAFVAASDAQLASLLHEELQPVVERYEHLKALAGRLDFLDLLLKLRDLVRDHRPVREELQRRFTHLLVDEFQDTDPLQAELLMLLAANDPAQDDWRRVRVVPGKLFVVGDPKQAIYRFRRADVALYHSVKADLMEGGASVLFLRASFRSAPDIQHAVNASFEQAMAPRDGGCQAEYVALHPVRPPETERPSVIALPVPAPFSEWGKVTTAAVDESLPDAVGAFVHWLVNDSGWTVSDRESPGERVPLQPRHICLLFKRFQAYRKDVTRPYLNALEVRRVPHVLVGGRSWHTREEIGALRTALAAIEYPDDELSLYATLRGPFFSLPDDALLAWQEKAGSFHPFRPVIEAELTDTTRAVHESLRLLGELHDARNTRPVAWTLSTLLERTRAHAGLAIWQSGEQVLANLGKAIEAARRFDARGGTSFRAFVERLEADAERGDTAEAAVVEEGTAGVRVMTAHRSKGLEFPVVILCDPTAPQTPQNPSRWVDAERGLWVMPLAGCVPADLEDHRAEVLLRDEEEAIRLAYVAATRARDLLVVPTVGEDRLDGWLDPLWHALEPSSDSRHAPKPAPGCPSFGLDTVVTRPEKRGYGGLPVRPGLHVPRLGEHRVTWWDPHRLTLGVPPDLGLRHQALLEADKSGLPPPTLASWTLWQASRAEALEKGSRPSMRVSKATDHAVALAQDGGDVTVRHDTTGADRAQRPHGKRFGTLVHEVLAIVPLDASREAVERLVGTQGRTLGATADECVAAIDAVLGTLGHPLLRRAAASPDLRRESPLLVRTADGSLLESVVDLAWREADEWFVVDFKTDREVVGRGAAYERQVRLYAEGITDATGLPATPILLSV